MFERRGYHRKSGSSGTAVLLALGAAGLLFLILRPGADKAPQPQTAPIAAEAPAATAAKARSPAEPEELSGLRQQVEQASQNLDALRSAAAEMRTELGELRKQRAAMLHPPETGQPAGAATREAAPPEPANAAAGPARAAPVAAKQANAEPSPAAGHPVATKPAHAAPPSGAKEPAPKPVRYAHNATGYLLSARDQLQSGSLSAAEDALERAETWALNSSGAYRDGVDPTDDPLVETIRRARADLRAGRSAAALRKLDGMFPKAPRTAAANRRAER